ncbi:MAG TPA: hypothetical protein VI756_26615, partial [Blastocatellia bacterium]
MPSSTALPTPWTYTNIGGSSWTSVGAVALSMPNDVYPGLAVTGGKLAAAIATSSDKVKVSASNSISLTVSVNPSDVIGGNAAKVTVTLPGAQSSIVVVDLSSSSPSIVSVPKSVT